MKKKQKAFTLIELLVVISIIALLVAILMPALGKAKDQARELICKTNLKTYGTVAHMYLAEQDNQFPSAWNSLRKNGGGPYSTAPLDGPLWEYLGVQGINVCPVFESVAKMKGFKTAPSFTYSMNILIGWDGNSRYMKNASRIERPANTFFFAEENLWTISGINGYTLNDNALCTIWDWNHDLKTPPPFTDSFADFHGVSRGAISNAMTKHELTGGYSVASMMDGHVQIVKPEESYFYSRPTKSKKKF